MQVLQKKLILYFYSLVALIVVQLKITNLFNRYIEFQTSYGNWGSNRRFRERTAQNSEKTNVLAIQKRQIL